MNTFSKEVFLDFARSQNFVFDSSKIVSCSLYEKDVYGTIPYYTDFRPDTKFEQLVIENNPYISSVMEVFGGESVDALDLHKSIKKLDVYSIDIDNYFKKHKGITYIKGDCINKKYKKTDLIFVGSKPSINNFSLEQIKKFLHNAHSSLNEKGFLIISLNQVNKLFNTLQFNYNSGYTAGKYHVAYVGGLYDNPITSRQELYDLVLLYQDAHLEKFVKGYFLGEHSNNMLSFDVLQFLAEEEGFVYEPYYNNYYGLGKYVFSRRN